MKIEKETIKKIAHLARLEFDEKDEESLAQDMTKILDWMDKLNELDTNNVEPLIHMSEEVNVMREDVVNNSITREEGLYNAPKKDSDYIRVPKFLS
ncbi:MAG TPA: Asp-tRNA(Asn)/Glu-tRNA(Gln) amidotransferase subunit GatC [Cytophagaceae bacterium]|jgi:aspartyl-tRNA(Asn)/glutamyl-tRNA(Gln) amidotransferase subunit C